jgi:hypothetical protein
MKLLQHVGVILFWVVAVTTGIAAPTCEIAPQKKQLIESLLCGQNAPEEEYRQSGAGCFRRSVEKRLEDSAIQIHIFSLCGELEFAKSIQQATVDAMKFMEMFAPCVTEKVDIKAVMDERTTFVQRKAAGLTCTSDMRAMLERRKPAFDALIAQSKDMTLFQKILDNLEMTIDAQGNLFDR